ncbi:MAG: acyl-CoA dehydrogenase [Gammaproteobacteria bacterium]|nr:acyl-CoA dehydrogenase [Gammaproteobacteria bacterium]
MSTYTPPIQDMRFVLNHLADVPSVAALPGYEESTPDLVEAIMDEAGKFASEVLAPLNMQGDQQGCQCKDGVVTTADGFKDAYRLFVETGWNALPCDVNYGGQGQPTLLTAAVHEMWKSANLAFMLCPMLTLGAVEALRHHASDEIKAQYLPKMVEGKWTGTMNLTEPQAGSDLSRIRSKAVPQSDGTYLITGTKIFITWGEHDMAENIVQLVLARLPDAPAGVKGISLFVVPKFMVNADGSPGARNDLICASIEHKLGIHGSATAVMVYGEKGGATGYLVGEANKGLACMFTMMNHARLNVGLEAVALSERAYQHALAYARERVQSVPAGDKSGVAKTIIHHADVRRMLMDMKSRTEAMRALLYWTAAQMDHAQRNPDAAMREKAQATVDFMIPVVKGWCTESSIEIASTGIQIHGGVGFVEETGASQYLRDARITTIYEGTTGIHGNDLIGRKLAKEKSGAGATARALQQQIKLCVDELSKHMQLADIGKQLAAALADLETATEWMLENYDSDPQAAHAGAVPYLMLNGIVLGGWQMGRAALVAQRQLDAGSADGFLQAKLATARYFAAHQLPKTMGYCNAITEGADAVLSLDESLF